MTNWTFVKSILKFCTTNYFKIKNLAMRITWPSLNLTTECIQGESSNQLSHISSQQIFIKAKPKKHKCVVEYLNLSKGYSNNLSWLANSGRSPLIKKNYQNLLK